VLKTLNHQSSNRAFDIKLRQYMTAGGATNDDDAVRQEVAALLALKTRLREMEAAVAAAAEAVGSDCHQSDKI